jgi:hypothetical protein
MGGADLSYIATILSAVAALGTAAAGLVDVLKTLPDGGVSMIGFGRIRAALTPVDAALAALPHLDPYDTLHGNWINGVAEDQQKAVAKALIHLGLTTKTAPALAAGLGIDPVALMAVAQKIEAGGGLTSQDSGILGRFDTLVGAILDAGYERGDQQYRNWAKLIAMVIAVVLAAGAAALIDFTWKNVVEGALIGLVSTPLAPIAKDLASSIQAAANAVNTVKDKA